MFTIEQFLDEKDKKIFQKYRGRIPFQVVEFASEIGLEVFEDNLGESISGKIEKKPNGNFVIYVNEKDSPTRQVFTIAHELGHYFRHKSFFETNTILEEPVSSLYNTFQKDRSHYSEEEKTREKEANEFAAELLMPETVVRQKWNELNGSLSRIAKYFNVSEIAMAFRIEKVVKPDWREVA